MTEKPLRGAGSRYFFIGLPDISPALLRSLVSNSLSGRSQIDAHRPRV